LQAQAAGSQYDALAQVFEPLEAADDDVAGVAAAADDVAGVAAAAVVLAAAAEVEAAPEFEHCPACFSVVPPSQQYALGE